MTTPGTVERDVTSREEMFDTVEIDPGAPADDDVRLLVVSVGVPTDGGTRGNLDDVEEPECPLVGADERTLREQLPVTAVRDARSQTGAREAENPGVGRTSGLPDHFFLPVRAVNASVSTSLTKEIMPTVYRPMSRLGSR